MIFNPFKKKAEKHDSILLRHLGLTDSTRALILNADDVGMHKSVNEAVFDMYDNKKISSMSLMACTPATDDAIKEIKKRNIPVGAHLTLTNEWQENYPWRGVLSKNQIPSLYNTNGLLWASVEELASHATETDVMKELSAQIDKLINSGLILSHLDTHMIFTAGSPLLMDCFLKIVKKYNLPVVLQHDDDIKQYAIQTQNLFDRGFYLTDSYIMQYNRDLVRKNPKRKMRTYFKTIKDLPPGVHHLVIHPAVKAREPGRELFDTFLRVHDYQTFNQKKMTRLLSGCTLINYMQIKKLYD